MGGMTGDVTYEGEIGEYLSLIAFCERVHLGKQAMFGLGRIKIEAATLQSRQSHHLYIEIPCDRKGA